MLSSSWTLPELKTKRESLKQERKRSSERKSLPDSSHTHKDNQKKPLELKDNRSSRIKDALPTEAAGVAKIQTSNVSQEMLLPKLQKPEVIQETTAVKLHKPETRKGPKREVSGPEHEALVKRKHEHEQERGRKRRSEVTESFTNQVKNKFGSKHLEKTVSIRLVDIRNSDSDFIDEGLAKRNSVSLDVTHKLNKASIVSDISTASKTNGCLRKGSNFHSTNGPVAGHLKNWGKFRIPKRREKPLSVTLKEHEEVERRKPLLRPLSNTPEPSYPRTRLRTGTENDGYTSDSKAGEGELDPCLKRCHSHELRGDSSLGRRYGSDIIRRGVLAS